MNEIIIGLIKLIDEQQKQIVILLDVINKHTEAINALTEINRLLRSRLERLEQQSAENYEKTYYN